MNGLPPAHSSSPDATPPVARSAMERSARAMMPLLFLIVAVSARAQTTSDRGVVVIDLDGAASGPEVFFEQVFGTPNPGEPFDGDAVFSVSERPVENDALISIRRRGPLDQPAVLTYWTEDQSATAGEDYRAISGTHTFEPAVTDEHLQLLVRNLVDEIYEGDETFLFHISLTGGATLLGPSTAEVVILDDERALARPEVSFAVPDYPNLAGDHVLPGRVVVPPRTPTSGGLPVCEAVVPIRLDRPAPHRVEVTVSFDSTEEVVSIDIGGDHTNVSLVNGHVARIRPYVVNPPDPGARSKRWTLTLSSPVGAELGEPSTVHVVCPRTVRLEILRDYGVRCTACESAVWAYDAGLSNYCPADCGIECNGESAFREASPQTAASEIQVLRTFRDEVMSQSLAGSYYTGAFYGLSPELSDGLFSTPSLLFDVLSTKGAWIDGIKAVNEGRGSQVVISQQMVDGLTGILSGLKESGSPTLRRLIEMDEARLDLESLPGMSFDDARERIEQNGGAFSCQQDDTTLCLNNDRFLVQVEWTDIQGNTGSGQSVPITGDTGGFWFFDKENIELMVKVLDGTGLNGSFWVFYGALSNVEYTLTVLDTETGRMASYTNPLGTFGSVGDTAAIPTASLGAGGSLRAELAPSALLRRVADGAWKGIRQGWSRLWEGGLGLDALTPQALQRVERAPVAGGTCVGSLTRLCLNNDRFALEVSWRDFQGGRGAGQAAPLTGDTGTFWFFDAANVELVIKVLDGRALNGRFWVFYGALSNVEYTITVTDTVSGAVKTYSNPLGELGSVGDTEAF